MCSQPNLSLPAHKAEGQPQHMAGFAHYTVDVAAKIAFTFQKPRRAVIHPK